MRALVTGGGGFLGSRVAQMLVARGDDVTVLGRHRYPQHEGSAVSCVQADLRDAAAIDRSCQGIDTVFHVGALTGVWGKRQTYWDVNVDGTENVIAACQRNGVTKLVYTSSPSVVCGTDELRGVDESQPYATRFLTHYPATKAAAEQLVLAANGPELSTVALRPHLIWGPGDTHLIPRVVDRARRGKLMRVGDGENLVDITFIDNAAEAHLLACDALAPGAACAGKAYFISQGTPVRIWSWFAELLSAIGAPAVTRSISYRTAYALGACLELTYRLAGVQKEPLMTRFVATQLAKSHYFDISAARRDFGYHTRVSTDEGLTAQVAALRDRPSGTIAEL